MSSSHDYRSLTRDFVLFLRDFLRKAKKMSFINQLKICSGNTRTTIAEDQILSALQQLASNSNSANFNKKLKKICKLPRSLTTTMRFSAGISMKFFNIWRSLPTESKFSQQANGRQNIKFFHSLMHSDKLQTFRNISCANVWFSEIFWWFSVKFTLGPSRGQQQNTSSNNYWPNRLTRIYVNFRPNFRIYKKTRSELLLKLS